MTVNWIKDEVKKVEAEVIAMRRDFHQHPELGTQEVRTSAIVEKYLNELGIETTRMFNTGVVGCIEGGKPGKCLLLRADMDALPIQEETGLPFASENEGVMHACGHDGHTAVLLAAAKILAKHKDELAGTVKLVFQPNEEESGSIHMVEEGVLENPKPDASFGIHLWSPVPSGYMGLAAGPVMGEMFNFVINVEGLAAHSSTPNKGRDAILCACNIIESAQMIQTREIDPMNATCLNFGKINGGNMSNIIADHVTIEGCMRYLYDGSDEGEQQPLKRLRRIVETIGEAHGCKASIEFEVSNYVLINDAEMVNFVRDAICPAIVDAEKIVPYVCMAGEDFSEFSSHNNIPGVFLFVGVGDEEKGTNIPHHNGHFDLDEDQLAKGVEVFLTVATEYLK